jgi:hypothetical protein
MVILPSMGIVPSVTLSLEKMPLRASRPLGMLFAFPLQTGKAREMVGSAVEIGWATPVIHP